MDSNAEQRIDTSLLSINEKIGQIFDRMSAQNERVAKVEGWQAGIEKALGTEGLKGDLTKFETDHTGPGGDHDRIANFHTAIVGTMMGIVAVVIPLLLYLLSR